MSLTSRSSESSHKEEFETSERMITQTKADNDAKIVAIELSCADHVGEMEAMCGEQVHWMEASYRKSLQTIEDSYKYDLWAQDPPTASHEGRPCAAAQTAP